MTTACSKENASFLDPGGPIAAAQRAHLIEVVILTMVAVLPVFILVPLLLWRYRYRNRKARYTPDWEFSGWLDLAMWGIPIVIVAVLSAQLWRSAKALDPYKPIASADAPLNVQVVGLDWKWLFVYPDLGIATVNEMAFPIAASVSLELTSDTVMQSFMIGALAGQVYAMPGMRTRLHLLADAPGEFEGENTQFNGTGFAGQKFRALAMTPEEFTAWIAKVRAEGGVLDSQNYGRLAASSTGTQAQSALGAPQMPGGVIYFNRLGQDLFASILGRYHAGTALPLGQQPGAAGYTPPALPDGASQ